MRTFVHHNPLHGLEDHHFHAAIERAQQILPGRGYLPEQAFREYFRSGRILQRHLDAAIGARASNDYVDLAGRKVSQLDVLRARLIDELPVPPSDMVASQLLHHADRSLIMTLADHLSSGQTLPPGSADVSQREGPAPSESLAGWCDRKLGTQITDQINREMIKWCAAFLDEGHATWAMPNRDKGFYSAWKFLAQREWSPCGIANSRERLARLPAQPEDALLETLGILAIEPSVWQDYLSLHLAALPGWPEQ
jgi:uncharacterized protein YbcC (UPF0753/DUF2309 family)